MTHFLYSPFFYGRIVAVSWFMHKKRDPDEYDDFHQGLSHV